MIEDRINAYLTLSKNKYHENLIDYLEKNNLTSLSNVNNYYVTFVEIPKFGINPRSLYNTPMGIYSYPLFTKDIFDIIINNKNPMKVPFVGTAKYVILFKDYNQINKVAHLHTYKAADFSRDLPLIVNYIYKNGHFPFRDLKDFVNTTNSFSSTRIKLPDISSMSETKILDTILNNRDMFDKFIIDEIREIHSKDSSSNYITPVIPTNLHRFMYYPDVLLRYIKKNSSGKTNYNKLGFEKFKLYHKILGYNGIVDGYPGADSGEGAIHPNESSQAVWFSKQNLEVKGMFINNYVGTLIKTYKIKHTDDSNSNTPYKSIPDRFSTFDSTLINSNKVKSIAKIALDKIFNTSTYAEHKFKFSFSLSVKSIRVNTEYISKYHDGISLNPAYDLDGLFAHAYLTKLYEHLKNKKFEELDTVFLKALAKGVINGYETMQREELLHTLKNSSAAASLAVAIGSSLDTPAYEEFYHKVNFIVNEQINLYSYKIIDTMEKYLTKRVQNIINNQVNLNSDRISASVISILQKGIDQNIHLNELVGHIPMALTSDFNFICKFMKNFNIDLDSIKKNLTEILFIWAILNKEKVTTKFYEYLTYKFLDFKDKGRELGEPQKILLNYTNFRMMRRFFESYIEDFNREIEYKENTMYSPFNLLSYISADKKTFNIDDPKLQARFIIP